MKNITYDDDNNFIQKIAGVGLTGAAGYGLYRQWKDPKFAGDMVKKAYDTVFPKSVDEGYGLLEQVERARTSIAKGSEVQRTLSTALTSQRHLKDEAKMEGVITDNVVEHVAKLDGGAKDVAERHLKRFKIDKQLGLADVKDAFGNEIGEHYKTALEGLGFEVNGVEFSGTTGIFDVRGPKGSGKVKIRFAKHDQKTGQWLASNGNAHYLSKRQMNLIDKGAGFGAQIMDENTSKLLALMDPKRIAFAAAQNEEYINDAVKKAMAEKNMGPEFIDRVKQIKKLETTQQLQQAIDFLESSQEWVTANADREMQRIGATVPTDMYSRHLVSEKNVGLGEARGDTTPGSFGIGGDEVSIEGQSIRKAMSTGEYVREGIAAGDNSVLSTVRVVERNGNLVPEVLNYDQIQAELSAKNAAEAQFFRDASTGLGITGSGGKASELAFDVHPNMAATAQAERQKSIKGLTYAEGIESLEFKGEAFQMLDADEQAAFRMKNLMLRPDAESVASASYRDILTGMGEQRGSANMFGIVNPFMSDAGMFRERVSRKMMAEAPIERTVQSYVVGDKAAELSRIDMMIFNKDTGKLERRAGIIADLFKAETMSELLGDTRNRVEIKKGTIKGIVDPTNQIQTAEDLHYATESEGKFLKATADEIMTWQDLALMNAEAEHREVGEGIKLYSRMVSDTTKFGIAESKGRGSVTRYATREWQSGQQRTMAELMGDIARVHAGSGAQEEMQLASSLFSKTFAKLSGSDVIMGKNSPEMLPTMLNFISGQLIAQEGNVVLQGDAAKSMLGHLSGAKLNARGELNLTDAIMRGDARWNPKASVAEIDSGAFAQQMSDLTSLFGQMRKDFVSGNAAGRPFADTVISSLDVMQNGTNMDEYVGDTLDFALNWKKQAKEILGDTHPAASAENPWQYFSALEEKVRSGGLSEEHAKRMSLYFAGGINPNEIAPLAQGPGDNIMKVPIRSQHYFLDKPGILQELTAASTTDSQAILEQTKLMQLSLADDPKFADAIREYSDRVGGLEILDSEGLRGKFGDHILNKGYMGDLKDAQSELFSRSMFSSDVNPHGFVFTSGGRQVFMPGADFWGGATYLGNEERLTFRDFAMEAHAAVSNAAKFPGGGTEDSLERLRAAFTVNTASSKTGALRDGTITARGAKFSQHVFDLGFIHNEGMLANLEKAGAEEAISIIGNAATVSRRDYYSSIKQGFEDAFDLAKHKNIRLKDALTEIHGEDSFLHKNLGMLEVNLGDIQNIDRRKAGKLIADRARKTTLEQTQKLIAIQQEMMKPGLKSERAAQLAQQLTEDFGFGVTVRWPDIYKGSWEGNVFLPDTSFTGTMNKKGKMVYKHTIDNGLMHQKEVALGFMSAVDKNADFDGDKMMIKQLMSNEARTDVKAMVRDQQQRVYAMMKSLKDRSVWKDVLAGASASQAERTTILGHLGSLGKAAGVAGPAGINDIAQALGHSFPQQTAVSQYVLKTLTGAFNIQAQGTKGWFDQIVMRHKLNQEEVADIHNFVQTWTSMRTEQQIISSKHLEQWLSSNGHSLNKMENVTNLFTTITPDDIRGIIRSSGGEVHPVVMAMTMKGQTATTRMQETYEDVANLIDIQDMNRNFMDKEVEFKRAMTLKTGDTSEIDRLWTSYQTRVQKYVDDGGVFNMETEAFEKAGLKGKTSLQILNEALFAGRNGEAAAQSSDSILSFLKQHSAAMENNNVDDIVSGVANQLRRAHIGTAMEMNVGEAMRDTSLSTRKIIGQKHLEKVMSWVGEQPVRRSLMLAGAAMIGMTALNIMHGDGTPQDPNDLPSLNNPSFEHKGPMNIGERRTLNNHAQVNGRADLLTDSNVSYDSAMSSLDGIVGGRGYNSVSVRHDGVDPYRNDMYQHTH